MSEARNSARERLEAGEIAVGVGLRQARTVDIAAAMKTCGFDWLFIDLEHNSMSLDTAVQIAMAASGVGVGVLVADGVRTVSVASPAICVVGSVAKTVVVPAAIVSMRLLSPISFGADATAADLDRRFALMDQAGIALQVLSVAPQSPHLARESDARTASSSARTSPTRTARSSCGPWTTSPTRGSPRRKPR